MIYSEDTNKVQRPVPAVLWSIHPVSQIITIRPAWEPYTKLILTEQLDEYYRYSHMLALAKLIKSTGFYPWDAKYAQIVRRNLAFFRSGDFIYLGRNLIVDPWYFDEESPAKINFYNPFQEFDEPPRFQMRKR